MANYYAEAAFEHRFWLQILGDHARFIRDSLYPSESADIKITKSYITLFDSLLEQARQPEGEHIIQLTHQAQNHALTFRKYKLSIIERHLQGNIKIHLTPSFLNHMVNELEEYLLVLGYLSNQQIPPIFHELHHHMLWLMDASGHAGAIHDEMDATERGIRDKSKTFVKHFDDLYLKAVELTGFLRSNVSKFPALSRFNKETKVEIKLFQTFLQEIEEFELSDQVLSTFSALMADHMYREECYYLLKVAQSTQTPPPECDPTKPRAQTP
ncbi:DUF2935 domain-containing protein [Bacillaceae bacterium S4-13-58]